MLKSNTKSTTDRKDWYYVSFYWDNNIIILFSKPFTFSNSIWSCWKTIKTWAGLFFLSSFILKSDNFCFSSQFHFSIFIKSVFKLTERAVLNKLFAVTKLTVILYRYIKQCCQICNGSGSVAISAKTMPVWHIGWKLKMVRLYTMKRSI